MSARFPLVRYTRIGRTTENALRLAEIVQVLVKHGFADVLQRSGFYQSLPARVLERVRLIEAPQGEPTTLGARLCAAFTELGPTFIKLGQVLSTRPDLLSEDLVSALSHLQDRVDPLPFERIAEVVENALGQSISQGFAAFEPIPVASASLSQVYRARLRDGTPVAVKVQRPGVRNLIESDIRLLEQVAEWIVEHVPDAQILDPVGTVEEFARSVRRELDFLIEANIIEQFRKNFAEEPRVIVPAVHHAYTSSTVLTLDWVDGVRIDDLSAYPQRNSDPKTIALLGSEIVCRMVFEHRLFHADPHPGNILLASDNRIAFLDFGMTGHLEKGDVAALIDLFTAIFHEDSRACADALLALSVKPYVEHREALEHELSDFIAFEAQGILQQGQVIRGLKRATEILRRYGLQLAPRFALLLKGLTTIEVVGRTLDPDLDFAAVLRPYVEHAVAQRYQPQQLLREAQQNAFGMLRFSRQVPNDVVAILHTLRSGRMTFRVHHEEWPALLGTLDQASSRLAMAIVLGSLILGSSLLTTLESRISTLGLVGFILSGVVSIGLLISLVWRRR